MVDGTRRVTAGLIAILMMGGGAAQAAVATGTDAVQEQVSVADLDLGSAAGWAVAQRRLLVAAHAVCAAPGTGAVNQDALDSCEHEALLPARQQLAQLAAAMPSWAGR